MGAPPDEAQQQQPHAVLTPHGDEGAVILSADSTNPTESIVAENDMSDQGYFAPPPHLAARFYRNKASARRMSSAASSRRNSLSSVHSRASSVSRRRGTVGGCQSNYIAQHLRRASIIESRKARLQDQAAHAEQVRLRAALVKAAPRGSNNNSERKALAAQVAKEKYLANVAAQCAEQVAKAKRIAEEVKERKLAEETRVRLEMEERHAEAERRRAEYQRNIQDRRAKRAESAEKKLSTLEEIADVDEEAIIDDSTLETPEAADISRALSEEQAAIRIQRAWHLSRRCNIVRAFCELDLQNRAKDEGFEEMTALVAESDTVNAGTALLTLLNLQDTQDENAALNTRTFLSAYMITGHSTTVLNNKNGTQEQDLIRKASDLINNFEATVTRLTRWNGFVPNATRLETLSQAYSAYTSAFAAWRLQDSSVLIEGMVASFVELDAIWQTVKDDSRGEVASDYREGIRDNQVMLLSRIRKLAGPDRADFLIKKAIRESRKRRPKKRPTAEVRPRGVESGSAQTSSEVQPVIQSAVDEGLDQDSTVEDSGELAVTKLFTPMPSNRILTHELAIDKDYRLEDTGSEVRDQLYRSICENMKRGFEVGEGALWTVSAAQNVREKLLRMLKPGNPMYTLVSDTLDLESIGRQCQQGIFSYNGFFAFMVNILPKLCAPFRDTEMKALTDDLQANASGDELGAMTEKLFKVLRMVDKLSLDYTNFMIMNAAPTLIQEAAGYEQRSFAKDLESGGISLEKTQRFWRSSYAQLSAEADRRDPEGIRYPADRPPSKKVYTHGLVNLAIEHGQLQADSVPETLMLDFERLQKLRSQAIRVTVVGAILLTAKNMLKRDSRSQWKNEVERLWQLLSCEDYGSQRGDETSTAQKAFSILETAHNMPPATKQQVLGTINRFFSQAASASASRSHSTSVRFTDPVLKVLFQRLRTHILARLTASTSSERVRAASSASEALASFGMPEFTVQVGAIVETLEKVREVDWKAHGGWYADVFRSLQGDDGV